MKLSIQAKLLGTTALVLALLAVVGIVGINALGNVATQSQRMYDFAAVPLAD